ncbi:LysM peptidoglycan-binding domain-containing protein [Amylibacter sp.]|nr:LysM peptidoglycan-binding domain-containing protein [Amylibacter sp.]
MSAKKTETLKLEKSSLVKKRFGNSSEDKVILSFAAAFAILAVFFIVMETSDEKISSEVKQIPQDLIINEKKVTDTVTTVKEDKAAVVEEEKVAEVKEGRAAEVEEDKAAVAEEDKVAEVEEDKVAEVKEGKAAVVEEEKVAEVKENKAAVVEEEKVAEVEEDKAAVVEEDKVAEVEEDKAAVVEEDKVAEVEEDKASEVKEGKAAEVEDDKVVEEEDLNENNPKFDLVRVEEDGSAIIAGSAKPNSEVRLLVDGKELEVVEADGSGTFAILTTIPTGEKPLELQLEDANDNNVKSKDTVLVIPNKETENKSPKIVIAETSGEIIVQDQNELAPEIQSLSLDTINYAESGDVILAGRAASEQTVRIYVDNKPVVLGEVTNGKWNFEIPNIEEGIYTLRVDAINEQGEVVDRVESPFQRVILEMERGQATIQPGFTLWKLAELKYGFGMRYVQIFEANRDSIKDPDLIYPGQVFQIPEK